MNWKKITSMGVMVLASAIAAAYANGGESYLCPLVNHCEKVNEWVENNDVPYAKFNCHITNIGHTPIGNVEMRFSGDGKIKEVWEMEPIEVGHVYNFAQWRQQQQLAFNQSHPWGYTVQGGKELNVNLCGAIPTPYTNSIQQQQQQKSEIICNLSNKCTVSNQWKNGDQVNTQYKCSITNNGNVPVSFIDIRINGNTDLYNVWEIITPNNGLTWDLTSWRIEKPLEPTQSHEWGYIIVGDKPLDVQVCQNTPSITQSPSPVNTNKQQKSIVQQQEVDGSSSSSTTTTNTANNNDQVTCIVSNKCTVEREWKNGDQKNKQYSCEITNNGKGPLSHVDIRLSNNSALYNVWEVYTVNNGLTFDISPWRIDNPIQPGQSHSWGYIVNDDVALDVKVCQMGPASN
ncbi:hypothetical protein RB653_005292 [Dictyostelium firmibasis]|uniref:Carbohydrate binding domain-containing protein n=1 Tax=Dictyostelium firmibasis TaxID=79012 RepID=A0AAN7U104_9MYCE